MRLGLRGLTGAAALGLLASCYSAGQGTAPPNKSFYFPVGLVVSHGGNVLYAVNSDFDLQWNGGTLQSYDLELIRQHTALAIKDPNDPSLPLVTRPANPGACPATLPPDKGDGSGQQRPLGETCAPPVQSEFYERDSAVIGAFATDLQLSYTGTRLFTPVRGDATITWADVAADDPNVAPPEDAAGAAGYAPFHIDCGSRVDNRCDDRHHTGNDANAPGNSRHVTMPGEPFGMAQSEDGTAIVVTHQTDTKSTLFSTGMPGKAVACATDTSKNPVQDPSIQFVLDGVTNGGNGVVAVPHDPDAYPGCAPTPPRPAFLQTSRAEATLDLLRYYPDQGSTASSSIARPYLIRETTFPLTANAGGSDSRGIVIDDTPRRACKAGSLGATPEGKAECARLPARVYFANRAPASIILGEIGEASATADGAYDADKLTIYGNVPLSVGPSRLYLAPVVDRDGTYALRLFIVCFDASVVYVFDPEAGVVENIIRVGPGPFAMAFDPFDMDDVALHKKVDPDPRAPTTDLKKYRFAYVASFTDSYVQVIDLDDNRVGHESTYETVVYTLGNPTPPKGGE